MSAVARIFVPGDAAARSLGADEVAEALAQRLPQATLTRNGSRGAFWLEPLVEFETAQGRIGFGPVAPGEAAGLLDAGDAPDISHPKYLGKVEALPWFAGQTRLSFARCGVIDPLSIAEYEAAGGLGGLRAALAMAPAEIVAAVTESGLRGRGGAGFPSGIKWRTAMEAQAEEKYIVCNADEGDSGTFADRLLMEGDPFALIEGMAIAGLAIGAAHGFIYLRSEYPDARRVLVGALEGAREHGLLGEDLLGSGRRFDIELRMGAGAYICGEETSLLESLEGKRGQVRPKPPLPAIAGLFGKPTVVNNVLSLSAVPHILRDGAAAYAGQGTGRSLGTQPVQLAGNIARGGLVEVAFGISLRTLIEEFGGGTASGRPLRAIQMGGPLGAYWPDALLDTPLDYEAIAEKGGMLGHGGIVVFDDTVDLAAQAEFAFSFCALESCGKCTPCRIGTVRGAETVAKIRAGETVDDNIALVRDLCEVLRDGSLCALGGLTPMPVESALDHFPEDFAPAARQAAE